jgi:hypothetical protein
MRPRTETPAACSGSGYKGGTDLLQTVSAIASVLGFLIGLVTFVPFLGSPPQHSPLALDVLRPLSREWKAAVLLFSMPIFSVLDTFLVISMAKAAVSLLRHSGVELYGDASAWLLLLFVLFPVALGATLAFVIVLFGEVFSILSLACIVASLVVTGFCAFRWLQSVLY